MLRFTDNLIIQTTLDCNYNCKFCMQGLQSDKTAKFHHKKITFEDAKKIIDTAIYERCILGNPNSYLEFHLHGGEAFLLGNDLIKQIVDYILKRKEIFPGLSISTQTNGSLLTKDICQFFADKQIPIGVSFDGFTDDEMHGNTGKENEVINRLKIFREETGVQFGFLAVLSKSNVKTLYKDFIKLSHMFPCFSYVGANILCNAGNGSEKEIPSWKDVWKYYYKPILEDTKNHKKTIRDFSLHLIEDEITREVLFSDNLGHPNQYKTGCYNKLCGFGSNMISIDPNLKLSPCDKWMEKGKYINVRPVFDLDKPDFLGMQHLKFMVNYYSKFFELENKYHCDTCPAKYICPGECQSYQLSIKGHLDQDENTCNLYKKIYEYVRKNWIPIAEDSQHFLGWEANIFRTDFNSTALLELQKYRKTVHIDDNGYFSIGDIE